MQLAQEWKQRAEKLLTENAVRGRVRGRGRPQGQAAGTGSGAGAGAGLLYNWASASDFISVPAAMVSLGIHGMLV